MLLEKENDAHEFEPLLTEIEQSPANPLGNTVFWIVILFILFASLWMYFGKVDVVVTARGMVIPDGEQKLVQSLDKGVVSSILVKEGDYVEEGQIFHGPQMGLSHEAEAYETYAYFFHDLPP